MGFSRFPTKILQPVLILLAIVAAGSIVAPESRAATLTAESGKGGLGTIKGIVRDEGGSPIADATVAIFRVGTAKLLKQVKSAVDGSFLAKILPGTYTVLAVAQGFNPATVSEVQVNQSAQLSYGFKLERAGSGNTLAEKKVDRNSSKWRIRAAQAQRSIYQTAAGNIPIDENAAAKNESVEVSETAPSDGESGTRLKGQTVVESFAASSDEGAYVGFNFATLVPIGEKAEIVFAGQTGAGRNVPQRFETSVKFRPNANHQVRINGSIGRLGTVKTGGRDKALGQVSFQALDEWRTRGGVILVFGLDYSRFMGAGSDSSISPRLGLQFDVNSKTRFRTAYTTQTEERSWSRAIELEDAEVIFHEPVAIEDLVVEEGKPRMNKSRRFEFGVERILDNNSSIEGNVFFDATPGKGVGLMNLPFNALGGGDDFNDFIVNQQGKAQGFRVVYSRRLNGIFSTSAGYSFGSGQKLSEGALTNPADAFENDLFQSVFGQVTADLKTGTHVKTIFRLSPQATVFAIDPFQGRLAIYDPGLSVMITQSLPNLGLPFRAEAVLDARNLFDFQSGVSGEDGSLRINGQQRALRGGILVRF
jgi:Carboxypeptidase regulatory-like domain